MRMRHLIAVACMLACGCAMAADEFTLKSSLSGTDFDWSSGDSYEGGWKNDKRHGEGVMKYANGRVRKGRFENNEYVGI